MTITIRRGPLPTDHFTIISNDWVRDKDLSWAARGLLAWMQSHADGYPITEASIIAAGPSERGTARTMTRELEKAGYLHRERSAVITGGSAVNYVLTDPREGNKCLLGNDGEMPPRADQGKQAGSKEFPQASPKGQEVPPRSSIEDQEKTKTPSVSSRAPRSATTEPKATRLPEDFVPTPELRAWFADEKLHTLIDAKTEHDKFLDYWLSVPGVKGRKLDWCRTWRNWMREAADRAGRYGTRRPAPGTSLVPTSGGAPAYRPSTGDQRVAQAQILFDKYAQMDAQKDKENGL